MSNISILNTIGSEYADPPVVKTIKFTYNLDDIIEDTTYPPFIFAQSELYDNENYVGYNTFIYQSQILNSGNYFNTIINWNFVINSLQDPSDPPEQPTVINGSGLSFISGPGSQPALLPYPSSWNGSLLYNGDICGFYTLDIDSNGRRNFILSLTQNL
jgi:hypothetical protein